jgi:hypothetical protein
MDLSRSAIAVPNLSRRYDSTVGFMQGVPFDPGSLSAQALTTVHGAAPGPAQGLSNQLNQSVTAWYTGNGPKRSAISLNIL